MRETAQAAARRLAGQILYGMIRDHESPGPKFDDRLSHVSDAVLFELRRLAQELQIGRA